MQHKVTRKLTPTACRREAEKDARRCKIERKRGLMRANRKAARIMSNVELQPDP